MQKVAFSLQSIQSKVNLEAAVILLMVKPLSYYNLFK